MKRPSGGAGQTTSEFLWAASFFLDHYKLFTWLGGILLASGFVYYTPGQITRNLQAQVDTNRIVVNRKLDSIASRHAQRLDRLDDSYQMLNENVLIQIRALCADPKYTARERAFLGLTKEKCDQ